MKAKEKAEELYDKFNEQIPIDAEFSDTVEDASNKIWHDYVATKRCALIAVDEIIKALDESLINADVEYYKQVKNEIEKL
jgi:hypothetical protein